MEEHLDLGCCLGLGFGLGLTTTYIRHINALYGGSIAKTHHW